jgi:hypothetical protein
VSYFCCTILMKLSNVVFTKVDVLCAFVCAPRRPVDGDLRLSLFFVVHSKESDIFRSCVLCMKSNAL